MLILQVLGALHAVICDVQHGEEQMPFGGKMNVILVGDFHQFPPPTQTDNSLYRFECPESHWAAIGHNIFAQFSKAVVLTEQMRITDVVWDGVLHKAQYGDCDPDDIHGIEKLELGHDECDVPDFSTLPWSMCVLVTPHMVSGELGMMLHSKSIVQCTKSDFSFHLRRIPLVVSAICYVSRSN